MADCCLCLNRHVSLELPPSQPPRGQRRLGHLARHPLAVSGATLGQTLGERHRDRLVWLAMLAMPLLAPVALPGMSSAVGALCVVVAFGLLTGQPVALPSWLARRPVNPRFADVLGRWHGRVTGWVARHARPRWVALTGSSARGVNATMLSVAGLSMMTPVPLISFDNVLPAAAIVLMAWGMRLRDGWMLIAGYLVTVFAVASVMLLWWGGAQAVQALLNLAT